MTATVTSPYEYQPGATAEQYPAISIAAAKLGLLEDASFDASADTAFVTETLAKYFPDCTFETRPPGKQMGASVISFESLVKDEHRHSQTSGVRMISGRSHVWVEEMEGKVNMVSVLREAGAMIEVETDRLLSMMRGKSQLVIPCNNKTYTFKRENTPGNYLKASGLVNHDATREYINGHAAVLQSLALALLLKLDPRLVFLDVFERSRNDPLMFSILCALASKSGVDFTDRRELSSYAAEYFELIEKADVEGADVFQPNLQQVNELAAYFGRFIRLFLRQSATGR